jgi:hypothetical protein
MCDFVGVQELGDTARAIEGFSLLLYRQPYNPSVIKELAAVCFVTARNKKNYSDF